MGKLKKELFSLYFSTIKKKIELLKNQKVIQVTDCPNSSFSFFLAAVSKHLNQPIVYYTDEEEASGIEQDIHGIENCFSVPSREELPTFILFLNQERGVLLINPGLLKERISLKDRESIFIEIKEKMDFEFLISWLEKHGYQPMDVVTEEREFAVRGGIIDVYPVKEKLPIRIEFEGDLVSSLRRFDPVTQISVENIKCIEVPPASIKKGKTLIADCLKRFKRVEKNEEGVSLGFKDPGFFAGDFDSIRSMLSKANLYPYFFVEAEGASSYIKKKIKDSFVEEEGLSGGFIDMTNHYVVITEKELFGRTKKRVPKGFKGLTRDALYLLKEGDYVVHMDYGIGIFKGVKRIDGKKDFLEIHYAKEDKLFVPIEHIGLVDRYVGAKDKPPKLTRLGTSSWANVKYRVKRRIWEYAENLLKLYAKRKIVKGFSFGKHEEEMKFLSLSFPYQETEDQWKAIKDVEKDMERDNPMERIVCGDVGYGKTEVAIRAAVKASLDGKQVCILAPTTILALQHYKTFISRLKPFPLRVEMLSRMVPREKKRKIIKEIARGSIDIIIGTHILLKKDIKFRDLGLLIIDDEHRFGVRQKEKIKEMKEDVDVLYLTATPIPRTLYMALSGVRDISLINTPPPGRKDVHTEISPWNENLIKEMVYREKARGGLILFVHNRIETLPKVYKRLERILPGIKIGVAHGRMQEEELARIYNDFYDKKYDMLLSTAIVEAGLDIPDLNTIIVDRADTFGLSELHQLRGRVGRGEKKAYALFITPRKITEDARKRLAAIKVYSYLGAGFQIALRDMEIRGAGNILGTEQHGHIREIGLSLYLKLLDEAVKILKGEPLLKDPRLDIDISAFIPESYIKLPEERIRFYKRILSLDKKEEIKNVERELRDRFGPLPSPVKNILKIAEIRIEAKRRKIERVYYKNNRIKLRKENKEIEKEGCFEELLKTITSI